MHIIHTDRHIHITQTHIAASVAKNKQIIFPVEYCFNKYHFRLTINYSN